MRDQRPSAAEAKAQLVLELGRLAQKVPPSAAGGSVQVTHEWLASQKLALALCKNARASVPQLTAAITSMRRFL